MLYLRRVESKQMPPHLMKGDALLLDQATDVTLNHAQAPGDPADVDELCRQRRTLLRPLSAHVFHANRPPEVHNGH